VKVRAARLGTKGWGWQSWGVDNSESGNIAGMKRTRARVVEGGRSLGHFCLVFRNEHTVRRAIHISKFVS
jgi:hypothetical protein